MIGDKTRKEALRSVKLKSDDELFEMVLDHAEDVNSMAEEAYRLGEETNNPSAMNTAAFLLCVYLEMKELHQRLLNVNHRLN